MSQSHRVAPAEQAIPSPPSGPTKPLGSAHFKNDHGVPEIRIGVKAFKCIGVSPPLDHPHIFLAMTANNQTVCPYCATLFRFDAKLGASDTVPPGCLAAAG